MEYIGFWIALIAFAGLAAGAGGVAYGYRGQRDIERDQVRYLRAQLKGDSADVEYPFGRKANA